MKSKTFSIALIALFFALACVSALTLTTNAVSNTITLTNTANSAIVNFTANTASNFTIGSLTGVTITNLTSIQNVSTVSYRLTAGAISLGTTTSTISISAVNSLNATDTGTSTLTIVRTNNSNSLCSGSNPGSLSIQIGDLTVKEGFGDDEDYWYPLDKVEIEFDLDNNGNYDLQDIEITAILYDKETGETVLDEEDMDISDDDFDLDENDDTTITLTFQVPVEDLEAGNNDYGIIIAAKGKIDSNDAADGTNTCTSDSEDIEIRTDDEFIILDEIEMPESAPCGQAVLVNGKAWNIGDKDQDDVYLIVYNRDLKLNQRIELGDIDSMDSNSFDFEFSLPANATEKTYQVEFRVFDEDDDLFENSEDDTSIFVYPVKVENCIRETRTVSITAELSEDTPRAIAGNKATIDAVIKNTGNAQTTYTLAISGNSEWSEAEIEPTTFTLNAGESKTVAITLDIDSDAELGEKEFTLRATYSGQTTERKVIIELEKGFSFQGIINHLSNNWILYAIIFNVILIVAIIIVVVRISRR